MPALGAIDSNNVRDLCYEACLFEQFSFRGNRRVTVLGVDISPKRYCHIAIPRFSLANSREDLNSAMLRVVPIHKCVRGNKCCRVAKSGKISEIHHASPSSFLYCIISRSSYFVKKFKYKQRRIFSLVLSFLYYIQMVGQKTYSKSGEDILLVRLLPNKGVYVDVGAHKPRRGNNTYLLYRNGWHGITIEPNTKWNWEYKFFRRRDIHLNCGVGSAREERDFYMFPKNTLNTFDKSKALGIEKKKTWTPYVAKVEIRTLKDIFSEYKISPDLLCVDTEGLDLDVLRSNDWNTHRPKIVVVEDNDFKPEMVGGVVYDFMKSVGYELSSTVINNLIFKRKS